jgi:DNA repair protein RecN (Recombination protein N)
MLVELNITNFAIIDQLNLRLAPGFNSLTGETGAGKSIIIDAMGAMLGEKIGTEFVRHGTSQARVEGTFEVILDLEDDRFARLLQLLEDNSLLDDDTQPRAVEAASNLKQLQLILTRELNISGRSTCRINGSPVKQEILRQVGDALVDIHGQTAHISLLRVNEHLELLDQYAGLSKQRQRFAEMVTSLRSMRKEMQSLQQDERELARRLDLLKFQVEEIEAANLQPQEEEELQKERTILNSAEKISSLADRAYRVLYQGYEEQGDEGMGGYGAASTGKRGGRGGAAGTGRAVRDSLSEIQGVLADLERYEPEMSKQREALEEALYRLEDVAYAIRDFRDRIEADPGRLEDVEERLELIRSLKRKYGNSISEIIEFGRNAAAELNKIEHSGERLLELQTQEGKLLAKMGVLASEISSRRQSVGTKLATEIEQALADLHLLRARFMVNVTQTEDTEGVPVKPAAQAQTETSPNNGAESKRYAFSATGIDRVEFFVSLNPGEPPKPIQKVASGGETSRLMLALKSILAAADAIPTLIFDEVDVGVGGRSGQAVGEKLWQLSNQAHHQVICISHLPQTAAFGDSHFYIRKEVNGERTTTSVRELNEQERIDELAVMMGGVPLTDIKRRGASELLLEIENWKQSARAQVQGDYILIK